MSGMDPNRSKAVVGLSLNVKTSVLMVLCADGVGDEKRAPCLVRERRYVGAPWFAVRCRSEHAISMIEKDAWMLFICKHDCA